MDVDKTMTLWAEALESGEWVQCSGTLERQIDGVRHNCCLGVLEHVVLDNADELGASGTVLESARRSLTMRGDESSDVTPQRVVVSTLLLDAATSQDEERVDVFIHMNDEEHAPFSEIARKVRELYAV